MLLVDVVKAESSSLARSQHSLRLLSTRQEFDLQRREADALEVLLVGIHFNEPSEEGNTSIVTVARKLALERGIFAHVGIVRR